MNSPVASANDFLIKLDAVVQVNFCNPQFGVSLLAKEMGMSRSNLHRKLDATLKISASQYINHFRLKKAKEFLRHTSCTVSEIAFKVGFNNVSYFIKCFHEFYGYPPGEVDKREEKDDESNSSLQNKKKRTTTILFSAVVVLIVTVLFFIIFNPLNPGQHNPKKSIAVLLPYYHTNDSSDYLIDGIANALYSNLELIEDLNVTPWTSVIKYRHTHTDISEIAKELKVKYIVELIGQNYGENNFGITVSLINADRNKTIPINRYKGTFDDIYTIEDEISRDVAKEIGAKITPEESLRMEKVPTGNKTALRYYLQGLKTQNIDTDAAISFFKKAVEEDNQFALAYAELANTYRLLNTENNSDRYAQEILYYTDKAILYDNENDKCLIAKARILISQNDYELAINYLEKAVEYNPNSAISYRLIARTTTIGGLGLANSEKCVENAIKAIKYNLLEENPEIKSEDYFSLARALRTAGLYTEAWQTITLAIELNPPNSLLLTEKCELIIDSTGNYDWALNLLNEKLLTNPNDFRINLNILKDYYHNDDFLNAYKTYLNMVSDLKYTPRNKELSRLAVIYNKLGMQDKCDSCIEIFEKNINTANYSNYYKTELLIRLCCLKNDSSGAMEQFRILNQHECAFSNFIRQFRDEPIFENLRKHAEFQNIYSEMTTRFDKDHERIKESLEYKGLLPLTD